MDAHGVVCSTPLFAVGCSPAAGGSDSICGYVASGGDRSTGIQRVERELASQALNEADMLDAAREHARVIDGLTLFCDQHWCASHDAQRRLLFVDNGHLSHLGSRRLAKEVMLRLQ